MDTSFERIRPAVETAGYEALRGVRDGTGTFVADGLRFAWEKRDDADEVVFYVSIGSLPPQPSVPLCEYLLEQNCLGAATAGGHIGLYAPTRVLLYSFRTQLDAVSPEALANMLRAFVAKATNLIADMQNLGSSQTSLMDFSGSMLWV